jgi:hypothetical protein
LHFIEDKIQIKKENCELHKEIKVEQLNPPLPSSPELFPIDHFSHIRPSLLDLQVAKDLSNLRNNSHSLGKNNLKMSEYALMIYMGGDKSIVTESRADSICSFIQKDALSF